MKQFLLSLLLTLGLVPPAVAGGFPTAGGYVSYANIPVWNWDNLAVGNCNALESWANCSNTLVQHSTAGLGSPVTISAAGTYNNISALSTSGCAITITNAVTGTVKIFGATIAGPSDLICDQGTGSREIGLNQGFSTGATPGKFYSGGANGTQLYVHDNVFSNLWGIYVLGGNGTSAPLIDYNFSYNTTNGGSGSLAHFVQLNQVTSACGQIQHNTAINAPYRSHSEDVMNIYSSPATSGCPLDVSFNHILGAYPSDPAINSYSGGGIIVDGSAGDTSGTASQFVHIHDDVVLDTTNYGVAIAAGHDNSGYNNTVVAGGVLGGSVQINAQNVGVYVWNVYSQGSFANDTMHDNQVYWWDFSTQAFNMEFYAGTGGSDCSGGSSAPACTNTQIAGGSDIPSRLTTEAFYVHKYFGSY
jgi:hypothetical protein